MQSMLVEQCLREHPSVAVPMPLSITHPTPDVPDVYDRDRQHYC